MDKVNRDFLHDVIADVLGVDGRKVIWAGANAPKIKPPFFVLHLFGEQSQAGAELRKVQGSDGLYKVLVPSIATLEVQAYGAMSADPSEPSYILTELVRSVEKPTVVDRCFVQGVSFAWAEAVQDIPELVADGAQSQPRAGVDFHITYMHEVIDDLGVIEKVHVNDDFFIPREDD